MATIIRVNMETKQVTQEDAGKYNSYGSRGLIARFLTDEVDPACEPLGLKQAWFLAKTEEAISLS